MGVVCTTCGRLSQDREFCDYCNADLSGAATSLPPERGPSIAGAIEWTPEQRQLLSFPEASLLVSDGTKTWRVHWLSAADWQEYGPRIEQRLALNLPILPVGQVVEEGDDRWLLFEAAEPALASWRGPAAGDPMHELDRLARVVRSLADALYLLHQESLVWLNFSPHALDEYAEGDAAQLWITNLDLELFPFRAMPERVRVHPNYAAPEIVHFRAGDIGPSTDVFHLAILSYYWLAGQWPDGLPGEGLERVFYDIPPLRIFNPDLPEGIIPVLMRGLSLDPKQRHADPREFADALDAGIAWAKERRTRTARIRWDIGGESRAGRSKTELQRMNEDAILMREDATSALVAVADGVSTCDIGSGGLASVMTTIVIENAFADACTHDTFPDIIAAATRRGSEGLLDWAIAHHCKADLEAGKELMGTTLTVGWIEGCEVSLANLGDSRAYLVTDNAIEQLTVDGDLAADLLARGASPEEVKELGVMARSLRECVGGCIRKPDGTLSILTESTRPRVSRWPLVPGDILVLCSDGLVEEGFFLDPATVASLVRAHRKRSAMEIAARLVEAADALQRVPTVLEPEGFGDNISCVVVKIQ